MLQNYFWPLVAQCKITCHSEIALPPLIIREVNKDLLFYVSLCLGVTTACSAMQGSVVTWPNWGFLLDRVSVHSSFSCKIMAHACWGEVRLIYCIMFSPCNGVLVGLAIAFACFIFNWILQLEGMLDMLNFGMRLIPKVMKLETLIR